eukprot:6452076-Heterocapsa_arctica.AAC.1
MQDFAGGDLEACNEELQKVHYHVWRAGRVPLIANRSRSFFIDKGTGAPGLTGQRLLHLFCAYWRNYYGA